MTMTRKDETDSSPMQFVSTEQLAYYRALEAALVVLVAALGSLSPPAVPDA